MTKIKCDSVNHTRFPKEDRLRDWVRRYNKVTKGDGTENPISSLYCICSPSRLSGFFSCYLKKRKDGWKKFINTNLFWFSQHVSPQRVSLEAEFNLISKVMCTDLRVRHSPSWQILMRLEFLRQIFPKLSKFQISWKIVQWEDKESWKEL